MTLKLLILKSIPASLDGMNVMQLKPEDIVEINEEKPREMDLGSLLTREGYAKLVSDDDAAQLQKLLSELTPEEREARIAENKSREEGEKAAAREFAAKARTTRRQPRAAAVKPPPPTPPVNPRTPTKPDELKVGDVVHVKGMETPIMTITKIETPSPGAVAAVGCTWFEEVESGKKGGDPQTATFPATELVKVEPTK